MAGTQHIRRAPVTGRGANQPALEFHSPAGLDHIKHPVLTPEAGASRTAFPAPGTRGSGTGRHLALSRRCESHHGSPGSHTHIRDQVWGQGWREGSGAPGAVRISRSPSGRARDNRAHKCGHQPAPLMGKTGESRRSICRGRMDGNVQRTGSLLAARVREPPHACPRASRALDPHLELGCSLRPTGSLGGLLAAVASQPELLCAGRTRGAHCGPGGEPSGGGFSPLEMCQLPPGGAGGPSGPRAAAAGVIFPPGAGPSLKALAHRHPHPLVALP